MRFSFTKRERRDLLKSWVLVSLAFAIFIAGIDFTTSYLVLLAFSLATAALTVGLGFLAHELSHKWVAHKYDCYAEYRSDNFMLVASLVLSLFKVFVAAPGAVHISGHADHEQVGKISIAGPAANIVLALLFLPLFFLVSNPIWKNVAGLGTIVNSTLAVFNLLPFGFFDGAKVIAWSKVWYGVAIITSVLLMFASFMLVQSVMGLF